MKDFELPRHFEMYISESEVEQLVRLSKDFSLPYCHLFVLLTKFEIEKSVLDEGFDDFVKFYRAKRRGSSKKRVSLSLNPQDYEMIKDRAEVLGMSMNIYLQILLYVSPDVIDVSEMSLNEIPEADIRLVTRGELLALKSELRQIGVNLNQIAHAVNWIVDKNWKTKDDDVRARLLTIDKTINPIHKEVSELKLFIEKSFLTELTIVGQRRSRERKTA